MPPIAIRERAIRSLARQVVLVLLVLAVIVAGCSGDDTDPTVAPDVDHPDPAVPPDVDGIVDTAAETMGAVDTVRFAIERTGAPVYIDPEGRLELIEAEGHFEGPSSAEAVVVVGVAGVRARVGAVAIDGDIWVTNPVTGDWEPTPDGYALDPAALFDPGIGFRPLLAELTDRRLVGIEERDGDDLYHVTGTVGAERLRIVTAGLVEDQETTVDLWLDPVGGALRRVELSTVDAGEISDWRLTFADYGADVTVETPDLDG